MVHRLKLINHPSSKTEMHSVEFKTLNCSQNDARSYCRPLLLNPNRNMEGCWDLSVIHRTQRLGGLNQKFVRSRSNRKSTSIPFLGFDLYQLALERKPPAFFSFPSFFPPPHPGSFLLSSWNLSKSRGKKDAIKNCLTTVCVSTIIWNNCSLGDSRQSINPQFMTQVAEQTLNE